MLTVRLLILSASIGIAAALQPPTHGNASDKPLKGHDFEELLRETLPPLLSKHRVPAAAVAVIRDGKLVATVVVGEQQSGKPATTDSLFSVASLTKPVFAHAVLALVDKGQFSLDEPLSRYWIDPDIKDDGRHRALTARLALTHRTGFPNWRNKTNLKFKFNPGEGVHYSGEGYEYLRRAIEAKLGRTMTHIVSNEVFAPHAMTNTHFVWNAAFEGRYAWEHDKEARRLTVRRQLKACAADDLITTIGDYGRFVAAVARGANLSPSLFNQVCSPQIPPSVAAKAERVTDFGLCWERLACDHGSALVHTGADAGVGALAIVLPQSKDGLVVMVNGDGGWPLIEAVISMALPGGDQYLAAAHAKRRKG